ncbi:MAG: alanyl-tRNA editing protein [Gammaproteobacteria bacterium]|nr:alanyl-tRNA editing protein [Gammaproteobacteria bacterium]
MTQARYLKDSLMSKNRAKITALIAMDDAIAVYCDTTIFYPQGGGQPCDLGELVVEGQTYEIRHVEQTDQGIAHIVNFNHNLMAEIDKEVIQLIDYPRRITNSRLHSAGHLISHILEVMDHNLTPIKGHHFLAGSFVEMLELERTSMSFSVESVNQEINRIIGQARQVSVIEVSFDQMNKLRPLLAPFIPVSPYIRMLQVDGYIPVPCGGTHISNTQELSGLHVTKIKRKKDRIKLSYSLKKAV